MPDVLAFTEAGPAQAAARFEPGSVHLWRLPYVRKSGREPLLRLLAAYLKTAPERLVLREGANGKPHLVFPSPGFSVAEREAAHPPLSFNWSHSGEQALVAIGRGIELGVDIERHAEPVRALEIARRFFAPSEAEALQGLDETDRKLAFYRLWCAKEAVLKARGEGLSFGLDRLVFSVADDGWRLRSLDPALGDAREWQLLGFRPVPGYSAALAWRGEPRAVRGWRLTAA